MANGARLRFVYLERDADADAYERTLLAFHARPADGQPLEPTA